MKTYKDYMLDHPDENLSWCVPYANDDETSFLIVTDGSANSVKTPDVTIHRNGPGFDDALRALAQTVNESYDLYKGWSDAHIAIEAMHATGCAHCPFISVCEAMSEPYGK